MDEVKLTETPMPTGPTKPEESYETKQARLQAAFNLVKDEENWKMPIDKLLDRETYDKHAEDIHEAVIHFTGSIAEVAGLRRGKVRITADGYYRAIGS